jgi:protein-tyrosine phosphatase
MLVNFRELKTYKDTHASVKPGMFFRSGELVGMTQDDQDMLERMDIHHIYDLRSPRESEKRPDKVPAGMTYTQLDLMKDQVYGSGVSLEEMSRGKSASLAEKLMTHYYRDMIILPSTRQGISSIFQDVLAKPDEPILFHCFAGKDRTGMTAGLILKTLGVSDEDVMHDYLLTNQGRVEANQIILNDMRENGASDDEIAFTDVMLNVEADYLKAANETIQEHFGDVQNYIMSGDGLGIGKEGYKDFQKLFRG